MSRAEFEGALVPSAGWWLTGEEAFLHIPEVMNVAGWGLYGSAGYRKLTEAQRVLMIWSDLVGQVANGGFEQFADNKTKLLRTAPKQLAKLYWPELVERFNEARSERAANISRDKSVWYEWDPFFQFNQQGRRDVIELLGRRYAGWQVWKRKRYRDLWARESNLLLKCYYDDAVRDGDLRPPEPHVHPQEGSDRSCWKTQAAEKFDGWFLSDAARIKSVEFVAAYIRRSSDQLVRLTD